MRIPPFRVLNTMGRIQAQSFMRGLQGIHNGRITGGHNGPSTYTRRPHQGVKYFMRNADNGSMSANPCLEMPLGQPPTLNAVLIHVF